MKVEQLTFTRFVAAMAIVIFHFGLDLPVFQNAAGVLLAKADTGVSYFYVLSGFIMILAYGHEERINSRAYLQNRIARIYPTYLTALLAHMVIAKLFLAKTFMLNVLAVQAWVPGKVMSLNYPGWSISVEFFFYLLFPLLFNFWYSGSKSLARIVVSVFLIWLASQAFLLWFVQSPHYTGKPSNSHDFSHYFPLWHLNQFLVGNVFGLLYLRGYLPSKRNDFILILLVAVIIGLVYSIPLDYHNGLLAWLFGAFIFLLARNTGHFSQLFERKAFVFLGEISFAIYMFQLPVYLGMLQACNGWADRHKTAFFLIYVFVLLVVSALSFLLLERKAQRFIRGIRLPF